MLHHSVLTPMLNIGLLTPKYIIERTLNFAEENEIPLNSVEGFVRQIIGWREFMRGMYELKGVTKADAADGQNWAWAMLVIKPKFIN